MMSRLITLLLIGAQQISGICLKPPRLLRPPCAPKLCRCRNSRRTRFGRPRFGPFRNRRRFFKPPPPPNPLGLYLGVMGAPVYGRDVLPFLGGLIDFETLEPRSSPNEYLAAPTDAAPLFDAADKCTNVPMYPVSPEDLRTAFEEALAKRQPLMGDFWAKPVQEDSDAFAQRFVYVERTPLFRFPDILNVQFLDTGNGTSTLVLHSASVFGQSDLGKNQERVEDLLKRMSDLPPKKLGVDVGVDDGLGVVEATMTATAVSV